MSVQWHVIYSEDGKVSDYLFDYENNVYAAESFFLKEHPTATYWELGISDEDWSETTMAVRQ
jgi:hypothetical protein